MRILVVGDFQGKFSKELEGRISREKYDLVVGVGDYGGISDWKPYIFDIFKRSKKGVDRITPEEYFGEKGFEKLLKKDFIATKNVLLKLNKLKSKVIYVFGNGDDDWYKYPFQNDLFGLDKKRKNVLKKFDNMKDITYGKTKLKGINFFGFGGYMDVVANYRKPRNDSEIKSYRKRLVRMKKSEKKLKSLTKEMCSKDIFILHYPPRGVFDVIKEKGNPYSGKSAGINIFREVIIKKKPRLVLCGHMHEYQGAKKIGKSLIVNPGDAEKGKFAIVEIPDKGEIKVKFIK